MLEFFRAIPPPVLVPVLMLLVGINDAMKIAVIISGCIWPVLLNTIEGVRAIDPVLTETAPHLRDRRLRPAALPGAARRPARRSWPASASACRSG